MGCLVQAYSSVHCGGGGLEGRTRVHERARSRAPFKEGMRCLSFSIHIDDFFNTAVKRLQTYSDRNLVTFVPRSSPGTGILLVSPPSFFRPGPLAGRLCRGTGDHAGSHHLGHFCSTSEQALVHACER